MKTFLAIFAIITALVFPCLANDSIAELATGGLVFTKSKDIEMRSEDLFISTKEIRVHYRFYNHSDHDVVVHVAFPMPDIVYDTDDFNVAIPTDDPQNILGFKTTINGRPVKMLVEQKAVIVDSFYGSDEMDVTQVLQKLGVPIAPRQGQTYDLPQKTWDELARLGLIRDTSNETPRYLAPRWTLKTTYYWQQTFPAHQELVVDHRYLPSVGAIVSMKGSFWLDNPTNLGMDRSKGLNRFCIDQDLRHSMVTPDRMWSPNWVEYILVTGANWAGPIGKFRLVIDKGSADNLVSFCGQGVRQISPTQFEVSKSNFTPSSNLSVLVLSPARDY